MLRDQPSPQSRPGPRCTKGGPQTCSRPGTGSGATPTVTLQAPTGLSSRAQRTWACLGCSGGVAVLSVHVGAGSLRVLTSPS